MACDALKPSTPEMRGNAVPDPNPRATPQQKAAPQQIAASQQKAKAARSSRSIGCRPVWIVLFAAILILTAGIASAQEAGIASAQETVPEEQAQTVVNHDGIEMLLPKAQQDEATAAAAAEARRARISNRRFGRPKYATVAATLANFDSDATPDGWRVEVMLFDSRDRPVSKRAHATFQLMPRLPSADYVGYVNAAEEPVRWSMPLKFQEDAVARVKLPLNQKLKSVFDRSVMFLPDPGLGISVNESRRAVLRRAYGNSYSDFQNDWRYNIGRPEFGQLKVRVSVPTEGVFEAVTAVSIRPPVLVDTNWPYR